MNGKNVVLMEDDLAALVHSMQADFYKRIVTNTTITVGAGRGSIN